MLRITSSLFKALDACGFKIERNPRYPSDVVIRYEYDEVRFDLKERIRQYRRELTPQERADHWNPNAKWTQIREPTGELVLKINSFMPRSVPSEWRDEGEDRLEGKLHAVIAGFIAAVAYARDLRERQQAEERRRERVRQEAMRREQEREAELARKRALRDQAQRWRVAADLRAYVAAVQSAVRSGVPIMPEGKLDDWAKWALAHADEIDPLIMNAPISDEAE